jgi:hypothetical protein
MRIGRACPEAPYCDGKAPMSIPSGSTELSEKYLAISTDSFAWRVWRTLGGMRGFERFWSTAVHLMKMQ